MMEAYIKIEKQFNEFRDYDKIKADPRTFVVNEGTEHEVLFIPSSMDGYFPITSVSRDDFEARGFDASKLTDEDMERIARNMAEVYVNDGGFWIDVDYWAEEYNCPKIEE